MRRLLVTGASGYLGSHLARAAAEDGWQVWGTYYSRPVNLRGGTARRLDLRDERATQALVHEARPAAIIHTACSNGDEEQIRAIVPAARQLARLAQQAGTRLVHLSTDQVFDGEHAPYDDASTPAPVTDYGAAKAQSEAVVLDVCPRALVARPSLIWGLSPLDRQTAWLVEGVRRGERVTLFTDELRCPVWVDDLCAALLELAARTDIAGPMNLGGPQALNRWDLGMRLLAAVGLSPGPYVERGTVKGSGLVRARNLTMISARAQQSLKARLRTVDEVIRDLGAARLNSLRGAPTFPRG